MKLVIVLLFILLLLVGSMTIMLNESPQHKNTNPISATSTLVVYGQVEGNKIVITHFGTTSTNLSNNSIITVSPDIMTSTSYTIQYAIASMVKAPTVWKPYFSGGINATQYAQTLNSNGTTGFGLYFMALKEYNANGTFLGYGYAGLNFYFVSSYLENTKPSTTWTNTLISSYIFKPYIGLEPGTSSTYFDYFPLTPDFANATAVDNITVNDSSIQTAIPPTATTTDINQAYQNIFVGYVATYNTPAQYSVDFYSPNGTRFNLTINNQEYYNVNNMSVVLKNGSYEYSISMGKTNYTNTIYVFGANQTINVLVYSFISYQALELFTFIAIVIGLMIVIMRYTDGSMIYLGTSGMLFIFMGYHLGIPYFNTNLILLVVMVIIGLFSYKLVME